MLKEHGLGATFYIAPQNQEFAKQDLLTLQEVSDLSRDFEIGGHSITHRRLATISEQQAEEGIAGSKAVLEEITGKEIKTFCYPGGVYPPLHPVGSQPGSARGRGWVSLAAGGRAREVQARETD